ncbi:glycosyltransferase [Porcincola intestinalis]|uniref:glycosyltransferase n=1 Tax=Porcincola intestinalis TaxID=2606632 RepID=UPI002A90A638|nr:glycosyltransferase [Porcincola intestinalis]MDY5580172.1 glycosyltransferase [Porcincola intestinalis]
MFCYVILHYKNIQDTRKCLDSLIKTAAQTSHFIVVDNGSNDSSGEQLQKEYKSKQVDFLILKDNIGFSKGNNVGFRFAKNNYSPDFMVISNNDVVFHQENFEKQVIKIYSQEGFDVLGPDVYIPKNKEHQNPIFLEGITIQELTDEIEEYKKYESNPSKFKKRLKLHWVKNRIVSQSLVARKLYSRIRNKEEIDYRNEYENVGLQGSCIIISKRYIQNEEKMFDPEPFLYCEEEFLYYKCQDKGYKVLYSPQIRINHEEAASFTYANSNELERLKFMLRQHVAAREMLLDYLKARED